MCLINNASIAPLTKQKTRDGFEAQFGTNYLGHFLLTQLLLDILNEAGRAQNCSHFFDDALAR
jgi:NAD(P)-dependent dehydrogenase (short-subunit alcohol dehydrogenase family)